jgi:carotenoid cleavage dioxygenase-like enzyme
MKFADNTNTNIAKVGDSFIALTESPTPIEFDPLTLETKGAFEYQDRMRSVISTAHPQFDFHKKILINYTVDFSLLSSYKIFYIKAGRKSRSLLTSIPVKTPAYMHSFGMTENYLILTEFPLLINPLRFLWGGKPFIENYYWKPERGTRFLLISKNDGEIVRIFETEHFFSFHHINAFEHLDQIVMDLAAYPDDAIIGKLYLDQLRQPSELAFPPIEIRRYRLSMEGGPVTYEVITDEAIELPRINDLENNAKAYRYAYGVGHNKQRPYDFANRLTKIDFDKGSAKIWWRNACFPGEPVYVSTPDPRAEDDGVVLSVILDVERQNSFLLILDAQSFSEIGRVELPHPMPFGFHGQFFRNV